MELLVAVFVDVERLQFCCIINGILRNFQMGEFRIRIIAGTVSFAIRTAGVFKILIIQTSGFAHADCLKLIYCVNTDEFRIIHQKFRHKNCFTVSSDLSADTAVLKPAFNQFCIDIVSRYNNSIAAREIRYFQSKIIQIFIDMKYN